MGKSSTKHEHKKTSTISKKNEVEETPVAIKRSRRSSKEKENTTTPPFSHKPVTKISNENSRERTEIKTGSQPIEKEAVVGEDVKKEVRKYKRSTRASGHSDKRHINDVLSYFYKIFEIEDSGPNLFTKEEMENKDAEIVIHKKDEMKNIYEYSNHLHLKKKTKITKPDHKRFSAHQVEAFRAHIATIKCLQWNSTGFTLAIGASDGIVKLISRDDIASPQSTTTATIEGYTLGSHEKEVVCLSWSTCYPNLLASASMDGELKIWDEHSCQSIRHIGLCESIPLSLRWAPHGYHIICITNANILHLMDPRTGIHLIMPVDKLKGHICDACFSSNSNEIYVIDSNGHIRIYASKNLEFRREINCQVPGWSRFAVCYMSNRIMSIGPDFYPTVMSLTDLVAIKSVHADTGIWCASFDGKARYIVLSLYSGSIQIIHIASGKVVKEIFDGCQMMDISWNPKLDVIAYKNDVVGIINILKSYTIDLVD